MTAFAALARSQVLESLTYRAGFVFDIAGSLLYLAVAFQLWTTVYDGGGGVSSGLSFDQTFLYASAGATLFLISITYLEWEMEYKIKSGQIALDLIKPVDFELMALAEVAGQMLVRIVAISIPTVLALTFWFDVKVQVGRGWWLLPLALPLAFSISFCIDFIVGLLGFATESIWGISITKQSLVLGLSGAAIPLAFYPDAMADVLRWLPFAAIFDTPLSMFTSPGEPWGTHLSGLGRQIFWAIALFVLTRVGMRIAFQKLRIAGG